ncbi:uncharacterized protein BN542_02812 [Clostridium sp. CAG:221]|uniref:CotH kinase family protein n=1 Tax=Clostridium sp. CAG:221 TaxID=1262780 RepID=UPI00033D1605|nr:CotH kinase family protein [Clostridium sp. CAG:221]CDB14689.1 uncharacterized protein BN542_02812 [Clostridium sp. CAG:221]
MKIKVKDPVTGQFIWVPIQAKDIALLDLEDNFENKNVEAALREISQKLSNNEGILELKQQVTTNTKKIESHTTSINNLSKNYNDLEERVEYIEANGGGGGGGGSIVPTITSTFTNCAIEKGQDLTIPIFFSSPSGGTGTAYILVNNMEVDYLSVKQGNNNLKIAGKYLTQTDNKVAIYVKDRAGLVSNQLEWNVIAGGITVTTTFDYEVDYGITDSIVMPYNIETGINGDIILHLTIDGTEYNIPSKNGYNQLDLGKYVSTLGTHTVSMYATVDKYTSSTIAFNLVITSTTELYLSTTFVDGSEYTYGVPISINYRLSKKSTELFDVYIFLDDVLEKTQELTVGSYYWTLNKAAVGEHKVTVRVVSKDGAENKSIDMYFSIIKGEYTPIEDITDDLWMDLNAVGKSNQDSNSGLWLDSSGNDRHAKMINFNFSTNGFIDDTVVCDNNAYIEIPYSPWETNAKKGSTIDLIYTPINSGNEDARVLDYTFITDEMAEGEIKPFKGVFADIRQAIVSSSNSGASSGKVSLDENSGQIHLTWVIDRENKFCKTYINGILSRIMFLSDSGSGNNATFEDFSHTNYIYLNSTKGENCGTNNIKRFRVWGHALTSDEVLKTHLATITDLEKQEEAYNFNYNNTTLPRMDLWGDITNMTPYQTVDMRIQYTSPNEEKYGASFNTGIQNNPVKIQGTSSLQYVRHNYTIYLKDEYGNPMMYNPYGEGNAMPDSVFCLKADYIESSHGNNTGMANFINDNVYDTKLPPQLENPAMRTTIAGFPIVVYMNGEYLGVYNFNHDRYSTESYGYDYKKYPNMLVYEINSNSNTSAGAFYRYGDNTESSANINERDYYARDFNLIYGNRTSDSDTFSEVKTLVEWVSVAEQDLFRETISEHFNKEYLFRYLLTVLMIGGVDSLGKNMKITTFDGKVWYPTFYDLDTCLGIDNSGYLTIEPDVEIEEGSFNTSNSNLWTKVMNYFASELKEEWALMRQGRFTLDNLLKYVVQNQIEVIPAKYYNDDAQVKYLDFGSLYTYCCHGSKELLVKRWLRERIAYVDSMMGYFTSQDDQVTIRMNKTGYVEFSVTPYIPLYFSVKWSNADGGTQTFKLKRGETKTFYYTSTTATDQEVIIYHAQYIKELEGISNLRPSSCILANATKLNNVEIHSDKLYNVNVSNNKYLRKLDLSGCSTLGTVTATGSVLDVSKCKYLSYLNIYDTALTGVLLNTSGGSLKEIYYPKSIQEVQLIKQTLLEVVGLPYGNSGAEIPTSLYTVDIQECPSIKKLNTSNNSAISKTWISMKYCQNLTIRNALDFEEISLDGFQRLKVLKLENMFKLKSLGFDDMLEVGGTSTLQYMGISYCPALTDITMNCSSNDYEITFANGALLNLTGATNLNSLSSNCVIHGLETIVLPLSVEHLYFTSEYGTGFSSIKNIWSSRCCEINTEGVLPVAIRYEDKDFVGIDLQGMKMKDIDLGALVNVPAAINFDLSPTTVNPNFNINRDGINYSYLQPVGTLDLSNYTGSLAKFFNGVDLDILEIIVNNDLTQKDLSYCFYNAFFSDPRCVLPITERLNGVINLDYCFYSTIVSDTSILNNIRLGSNCSMRYTFAKCPNITTVKNLNIPATTSSCEGMLSDNNNLVSVINLVVNSQNATGLLKNCSKLTTLEATVNSKIVDSLVEGCSKLTTLEKLTLGNPISIKSLIKNCALLTLLDLSKSNLSNCNAMDNLCYGATSLTELKMIGTVGSSTCTYNNFITGTKAGLMLNLANSIITSPNFIKPGIFNGGNNFILDLTNSDLSAFTDFTSWFENIKINEIILDNVIWGKKVIFTKAFKNSSLIKDFTLPLVSSDVVECFNNCSNMLEISSNWKQRYINYLTTTNCYAGSINIVKCDNYTCDGLDEVPIDWGGYGFEKDYTTIMIIDTSLQDGLSVNLYSDTNTYGKNVLINWGDGTVNAELSHTYNTDGEYKIKYKSFIPGNSNLLKTIVTKVLNVSKYTTNSSGGFIKISDFHSGYANAFSGYINVTSIDVTNADVANNKYIYDFFKNCGKLIEIVGINTWDTSKIIQPSGLFYGCSSLREIPLLAFPNAAYFVQYITNCSSVEEFYVPSINESWYKTGTNNVPYSSASVSSISGCINLSNIENFNVSFTQSFKDFNSNYITNDFWRTYGWKWFSALNKLLNIEFKGTVYFGDDLNNYVIFAGCNTSKLSDSTWESFVSIFPDNSSTGIAKKICVGTKIDYIPETYANQLTAKGYTLYAGN